MDKKNIYYSNDIFVINTKYQDISITNLNKQKIEVKNDGNIIYNGDPYLGEYIITPKIEKQILETKDKLLIKDCEIEAIPFFRTSNEANGFTVIIGG